MFFKDERTNTIILSVIWGFGIAALFRKVCDDNKCIVIKAPNNMNDYHQENKNYYPLLIYYSHQCFSLKTFRLE